MEWFSGDIAEAVRISKEKHVIFVVFIDGKMWIIMKIDIKGSQEITYTYTFQAKQTNRF